MPARQVGLAECRTVVDVLRWAAHQHPEVEAYVEPVGTGRRAMTFGAWDRRADGVAGLLAARGVGQGDVVALLLGSGIAYAVCYAAAQRLGAITTGLNPRMGPVEMRSVLERCRPAVTVVHGGLPPGPVAAGASSGLGTAEVPVGSLVERAEVEAAYDAAPPRLPVVRAEDPVAVVWTSGTTALPKGAVFTHRNLEAVARGTDVLSQPGDRRLSPLPFAHVGYMTRAWDEIAHVVTTVVTPTPWQAAEALRLLEAERITVGQGVPTQWRLVLDRPELEHTDLSALRIAGTGAARVPAELVAEMRARLGVPVVVRYTSTESSLGTGTRPGDPDHVVATTVGRPVPGVELQIVDDEGRTVPPGTVGRVRLRSAAAMVGYWAGPAAPRSVTHGRTGPERPAPGREAVARVGAGAAAPGNAAPGNAAPGTVVIGADRVGGASPGGVSLVAVEALVDHEATAAVRTPDGWTVMGDFGCLDADGNLQLAGRDHERYIRGGYNVYPAEVEEALGSHPAVVQVAVVGAPDPVLGEVGVAFVVPVPAPSAERPGGEPDAWRADAPTLALRAHCRGRIADYKAPDVVVLVDALPLTSMMKVDKRRLSAPAAGAAEERSRRMAGAADVTAARSRQPASHADWSIRAREPAAADARTGAPGHPKTSHPKTGHPQTRGDGA